MSTPGGNWNSGQYGQQPYHGSQQGMQYQGFGVFSQQTSTPPDGPQKPKSNLGAIALVSLGVVAVLVFVTVVVLTANGGNDDNGNHVAQSSTSPAPTSSATEPVSTASPVVPDWQVMEVPRRNARYDVPRTWSLESPDNIVGFGEPDDAFTLSGVALYQRGFCPGSPNSYRAIAGATARRGPDDTTVANEALRKFAETAYTVNGQPPEIVPSHPQKVSLSGGREGVLINATLAIPNPGECDSPSVAVSLLAAQNDGNASVVFVVASDQGIPDAVSPTDQRQIVQSFRPAS